MPASAGKEPISESSTLHARAMADLRFIREAMESASAFSAFSGWGLILIGGVATACGLVAARQPTHLSWLMAWVAAAGGSAVLGALSTARKTRTRPEPLIPGPARKFPLSLGPAGSPVAPPPHPPPPPAPLPPPPLPTHLLSL